MLLALTYCHVAVLLPANMHDFRVIEDSGILYWLKSAHCRQARCVHICSSRLLPLWHGNFCDAQYISSYVTRTVTSETSNHRQGGTFILLAFSEPAITKGLVVGLRLNVGNSF